MLALAGQRRPTTKGTKSQLGKSYHIDRYFLTYKKKLFCTFSDSCVFFVSQAASMVHESWQAAFLACFPSCVIRSWNLIDTSKNSSTNKINNNNNKRCFALVALPFTFKSLVPQKKNYGNSNILPCKNIIFRKSSKRQLKSFKIL
jgi:hypothetical protein